MNAVAHWFTYRGSSAQIDDRLALVADLRRAPETLLRGELTSPRLTGLGLTALHRVVSTAFYDPTRGGMHMRCDPIVTSDSDQARFEGFSLCCGVWARYDLGFDAMRVHESRRGTTNVDFGAGMRAAAASLLTGPTASIEVGPDALHLDVEGARVTEEKIDVPARWLRGLVEVQVAQAGMAPWAVLSRAQLVSLLQALPRTDTRGAVYVTPGARGFEVRTRETAGALPVHHPNRLRVIEPMVMSCEQAEVLLHPSGASAWVLHIGAHTFTLCLSPSAERGFSGEGYALDLDLDADPELDGFVLDQLAAGRAVVGEDAALARLGTQGLVGLDLRAHRWYHRALPYEVNASSSEPPRWRKGRALAEAGAVRRAPDGAWWVEGTDVTHTVRLDGAGFQCTCAWHARHEGARGPCAHVVAARRMAS